MNVKKYFLIIILFCLCLFSPLLGQNNFKNIPIVEKISVFSETLSTKIILNTNSLLPVTKIYYSQAQPSTIVLQLGEVELNQELPLTPKKAPLIESIDSEDEDTSLNMLIHLTKRVPFHITSEEKQLTVELNKALSLEGEEYLLSSEATEALEKNKKANILEKVEIYEETDRINIKAKLNGEPITNIFSLDNPLRLIIDLLNTSYSSPTNIYPVNSMGLEKIRTAQFKTTDPFPIARMVFDLNQPKYYKLASDQKELTVSFYKTKSSQTILPVTVPSQSASPPKEDTTPSAEKQKSQPESTSQDSDLSPPEKEKPTPTPSARKSSEPDISETKEVSTEKTTTNNVLSAKDTESNQTNQKKEEETTPSQEKQEKTQTGKQRFQSITIADTEEEYTGHPIDLIFKDADLRDVIFSIAEEVGLNTVFDPGVRGTVTCNWKNVPWDQALDLILKQNKMGKTIVGNVLRIAPISTLTTEQEEQRRLRESQELSGPLIHKTFELSYARAPDVQALLQNKISSRGKLIIDTRTNTLIISDVKERMEVIEDLISILDKSTPQVSIQARIVEANSNFVRNLGIQWGIQGIVDPFYGNQTSLQFPNNMLLDGSLIPEGITTKGIGGPLEGYAINLPAPSFTTALGLSFGNVLDTFRLDVALTALETSGKGKIISCPSITTQNNSQAEIIQGRQIPVQTVQNFTVTTRYQNAALELSVTPQITAEGTIIMELEIRNNAADFANLVNGIPPITTQSANTTVMVEDGGTTVIGGIYRTEDSITREKVPFLHKIPILGKLFQSFSRLKQNRELLIFITPRIIKR